MTIHIFEDHWGESVQHDMPILVIAYTQQHTLTYDATNLVAGGNQLDIYTTLLFILKMKKVRSTIYHYTNTIIVINRQY